MIGIILEGEEEGAESSIKGMLERVCTKVVSLKCGSIEDGPELTLKISTILLSLNSTSTSTSDSIQWAFIVSNDLPFISWQFVQRMKTLAASETSSLAISLRATNELWICPCIYHASIANQMSKSTSLQLLLSSVSNRIRIIGPNELDSWSSTSSFVTEKLTDKVEISERAREIARETMAKRQSKFLVDEREFIPGYLKLIQNGEFEKRLSQAKQIMNSCTLCGRQCHVNRNAGQLGFCKTGSSDVFISSAQPHFGEESVLVGKHGSGTIFFTSCNLLCDFCQNFEISHLREGEHISTRQLADIMLSLANSKWVENINLVTPTHQLYPILEAVLFAARDGLQLPLVWNCGGFESLEALKILDGIVDIYMPDFKFWDPLVAKRFMAGAENYPAIARESLKEMHRQVGPLQMKKMMKRKDEEEQLNQVSAGVALHGLIIRHLVMPNKLAGTEKFMRWLADEISEDTFVNIMGQYRPCFRAENIEDIARTPTDDEIDDAFLFALNSGLRVYSE